MFHASSLPVTSYFTRSLLPHISGYLVASVLYTLGGGRGGGGGRSFGLLYECALYTSLTSNPYQCPPLNLPSLNVPPNVLSPRNIHRLLRVRYAMQSLLQSPHSHFLLCHAWCAFTDSYYIIVLCYCF